MNEMVFLVIFLLLFIRLIGLGVSLDFYLRMRNVRFKIFILGWAFWFFAGIFPFLYDITNGLLLSELFLVINAIFAALGSLLIYLGFVYNFKYIQLKFIILICILELILATLFAILLGSKVAIGLSFITLELSIISLLFFQIAKGKHFAKYIGKSIIWYYITVIFVVLLTIVSIYQFLQGYSYGLYDSNDFIAIFYNYSIGISITILTLVFFIHFEYNILKQQKFELKDIYSHDLGNIMQSILSATELMKLESEEGLLNLIKEKCDKASELIKKIREL
ncbi:MAG: hypothetical protein ACFE9T_12400 [Promethearchaeota archaeon]